jgi:hypothetical protein
MLIAAIALVLLMAYAAANAGVARSGPVHVSTVDTGTDLQCGAGSECGPDNPATKVAPSLPRGPKVQR